MNVFLSLLNLIVPRECHICGASLAEGEDFVCAACMKKLPLTGFEKYWQNHTAPNSDLNPMEQRFAGQLPMDHACAPFFYTRDSALASLVHDFKYRNFPNLAVALGQRGAEILLPSGFFDGVDCLMPVPLHWRKKMRRGYNQSEMIARGISRITGLPLCLQLKAGRPHRTQTSLSQEARFANTKGIFNLRNPESLEGKTVMLVDDICTTGATLISAGEAVAGSVADIRLRFFTLGVVG